MLKDVLRRFARPTATALALSALSLTTSPNADAGITVFRGAAATPGGLTPTRDAFRTAIGGGNVAGPAGSFGGVRREINWDAVPDSFSDPNLLPANFFNVNSPRGAVFSTAGTGFLVSADASNPTATSSRFGFGSDFVPFSDERLFTSVGSNVFEVNFFVAGTNIPGVVDAFGSVFNDVEHANVTKLEAFASNGSLLASEFVDTASSGGLSFLGFQANAGEKIAKVRFTLGSVTLLSNGLFDNINGDGVVVDDFLYSEPARAVPEPGTLAAAAWGLVAGAVRLRFRRRNDRRGE